MAKVTITIRDDVEDQISATIVFDPPLKKDDTPTQAQAAAFRAIEAIKGNGEQVGPAEVHGKRAE